MKCAVATGCDLEEPRSLSLFPSLTYYMTLANLCIRQARKVFMYALINICTSLSHLSIYVCASVYACAGVCVRVLVCADSQQIYASNITNKIFAHESCKNFFAFALRRCVPALRETLK